MKKDLRQALKNKVDNCPFCAKEKNRLQHILGGGAIRNPCFFFVLINPTYRNITSDPDHKGPRIPFMGVSSFWRILVESGFLPKSLYFTTKRRTWDKRDIELVNRTLVENRIYLTNLVKCTRSNAELPDKARTAWGLKILKEEIAITRPKLIITFGQPPFKALTGKNINLSEYYKDIGSGRIRFYSSGLIGDKEYKVFPTYFPTGRGKPKESIKILKCLNNFLRVKEGRE